MKIITINCVYKVGSTGKIVYDLHSYYKTRGFDSFVFYGRGGKNNDEGVFKISSELEAKIHSLMSKLFGKDFGYSYFSTQKCIRKIKKINPDVVHLHCLNGHFINVYELIKYLKSNHIKTVLTLHAEIMHTAGCEHALDCNKWIKGCYDCEKINGTISHYFRDDAKHCYGLMKKAIDNFNELIVVGCSDWLIERAKKSIIFSEVKSFATVTNGLDTNVFCYNNNVNHINRYLVFHVTANFSNDENDIKGGRYIIELAKRMPKIDFVVAGNYSDGMILPNNVKLLGIVKNQMELASWYSKADLVVITSKKETFSMVVAESLCCGTPIVGFKAGAPEMIAINEFSEFVNQGDVDALEQKVKEFLGKKFDKIEISKMAKNKYSKEKMSDEYLKIYKLFKD